MTSMQVRSRVLLITSQLLVALAALLAMGGLASASSDSASAASALPRLANEARAAEAAWRPSDPATSQLPSSVALQGPCGPVAAAALGPVGAIAARITTLTSGPATTAVNATITGLLPGQTLTVTILTNFGPQ